MAPPEITTDSAGKYGQSEVRQIASIWQARQARRRGGFAAERCPSDVALRTDGKSCSFDCGIAHFCGKNATGAVLHSDRGL
jgi:hypothetical protein